MPLFLAHLAHYLSQQFAIIYGRDDLLSILSSPVESSETAVRNESDSFAGMFHQPMF